MIEVTTLVQTMLRLCTVCGLVICVFGISYSALVLSIYGGSKMIAGKCEVCFSLCISRERVYLLKNNVCLFRYNDAENLFGIHRFARNERTNGTIHIGINVDE